MTAEVTQHGIIDMQICVPENWTDEQVVAFANSANPTGIGSNWSIRREGDKWLAGAPERVVCQGRPGHVHIMLDC